MSAVNNALLQAVTTVNSAGAFFDRQAYLGVVTPYGAFIGGRQYTPGYEIINKFSVLGDQTALQFGQGYNTPQIRANNALQYRAELKGRDVVFALGYSHPIAYPIPDQIKVTVEENTKITIEGPSREAVGQVAAELRGFYPPEPYKGKGVRYAGEHVVRKEGKTVQ